MLLNVNNRLNNLILRQLLLLPPTSKAEAESDATASGEIFFIFPTVDVPQKKINFVIIWNQTLPVRRQNGSWLVH